jgi:uncharacterized membrane protein
LIDQWITSFYHFVNGMGYYHPIHPALVHAPMGLVIGAFFFGWVGVLSKRETVRRTALHCIALAFLFWFPVVFFGLMDWRHFYGGAMLFPIKMKMILAGALLIFFVTGLVFGFKTGGASKRLLMIYTLCFLAAGLMGFFGAELVYAQKAAKGPEAFTGGVVVFETNCVDCHPQGKNIIKPDRPIIGSPKLKDFPSFVGWIRKPVAPMPTFSESQISETQAKELYQYITKVLVRSKGTGP